MSELHEEKIESFLIELNNLTLKHGIYITTVLDNEGKTKDHLHLIQCEKDINSAGYRLQNEDGIVAFDWY